MLIIILKMSNELEIASKEMENENKVENNKTLIVKGSLEIANKAIQFLVYHSGVSIEAEISFANGSKKKQQVFLFEKEENTEIFKLVGTPSKIQLNFNLENNIKVESPNIPFYGQMSLELNETDNNLILHAKKNNFNLTSQNPTTKSYDVNFKEILSKLDNNKIHSHNKETEQAIQKMGAAFLKLIGLGSELQK